MLTRRVFLAGSLAFSYSGSTAHAADPEVISFDKIYSSFGIRGLEFSRRILDLSGRDVALTGYMAPPLKPESRFFVLTKNPVAICPFCSSDAEWPLDIVVVYLRNASALVSAGQKVRVTGRLEAGSWTDPETQFVSQLRIMDADWRR